MAGGGDGRPPVREQRRHALLVATSSYEDSGLRALRAPLRDATELARVLGDPAIGAFTVEMLSDPGVHELRRGVEDFFADCQPTDTLLLHFACHGLKDEGGRLFLAAADTVRTRLESTAIPAEYVSRLMIRSRAGRAAVMLDCCYAGAFERGLFSRADPEVHVEDSFSALKQADGERGRAVLTASSAVEYAFEGSHVVPSAAAGTTMGGGLPEGRPVPSLFTGALVEGLRTGDADLGGDGAVGLAELAQYIGERVRAATPNQNPQLWMFGAYGDLTIARAPRHPDPVTLPIGFVVAPHQPMGRDQRLRAVAELRTSLDNPDTSQALAACDELDWFTRDDDTSVRAAAQLARAAAAPRITQDHWDLGVIPLGRLGPDVDVPVLGPPVVRATVEASSDSDWLRARPGGHGIVLSVLAEAPGVHEARVVVRTATGECTLTARAEIAPHTVASVVTLRKTEPLRASFGAGPAGPRILLGGKAVGAALMLAAATESTSRGGAWPVLVLVSGALVGAAVVVAVWSMLWGLDRRLLGRTGVIEVVLCVGAMLTLGIRILVWPDEGVGVDFFVFAAGAVLYIGVSGLLPTSERDLKGRLFHGTTAVLTVTTIITVALLRPPGDRPVARYDRPRGDILVERKPVTGAKDTGDTSRYLRTYKEGPLYAAVTGYASQAYGTSLLENTEDDVLTAARSSQEKGDFVITTINSAAQKAAFQGLGDRQGAAVALDPRTGAILALVSTPSYDPSTFAGTSAADRAAWKKLEQDKNHPLLNRALRQTYPPGSTFKVITAAAALEGGLYDSIDEATDSPSPWILPETTTELRNASDTLCENVSLRQALAESCNTVFGKIGSDLGSRKMLAQAEKFGFNAEPVVPVRVSESVYPDDAGPSQNALSAIGQYETSATPLQMAMVAAAVGNDGALMRPYLVLEDLNPRKPMSRPLSAANADKLQDMMRAVVESGTGTKAAITGVEVGGKTGTAQSGRSPFSWFISYAKPEPGSPASVAVAVVVQDDDTESEDVSGGGVAAPIAKRVMEAVLDK
ncbi:caspase, EACC1-associated type [Streptomyces sp. 2A115]|uniref:caspase, EACC1-associated type n=1 Tax=Streptomyces sp. 2A115 TaxID=3457439 RepID=UPI003FD3C97E